MKLHPATWSLFLLLATGLVAAAFYALQPRAEGTPDLVLPTTDNETFVLSEQQGTVVLLDFFQIACDSCKILERELEKASASWNASQVRIVSIGLEPDNSLEDLAQYKAKHNLTWTVARDADNGMQKFGVFAVPAFFILNARGDVVFSHTGIGSLNQAKIEAEVARTLAQDRAPVQLARYSLWGLAVVAAVAAFFAPCAIGLLPAYVAHTVRFPGPGKHRPWRRAASLGLLAALGLLLVFLAIGGLAVALGASVSPYVPWLGPVVGVALALVGLLLLLRPYSLTLQRIFSPLTQITATAPGRAPHVAYFLYGVGYGAGAAGCTAPVIINLFILAAGVGSRAAITVVFLYAVTAALLMVVLTLVVAGGRQGLARWIQRHARHVEVASALFYILGGLFLWWYAGRAGALPSPL